MTPDAWGACAGHLRSGLRSSARAELDLGTARLFRRAVRRGEVGQAQVLLELRATAEPRVGEDPRLVREEERLRAMDPPRYMAELTAEWLEVLDMERGWFRGQVVDSTLIATIEDEVVLERLAARLPGEVQQQACARRLVQLRVEASPFAELHGRSDVVDRVLELGCNPLDSVEHALIAMRWLGETPRLWVEQDLPEQRATLLSGPPGALQPPMDLRQLVEVELEGVSRPVTACGATAQRDPSPCLLLTTGEPWATVTEDGVVHLEDEVPMAEAALLKRELPIGLLWQGEPIGPSLDLPVRFAPPDPLIFRGGPALELQLREQSGRLIWKVKGERTWLAVVESAGAGQFRIATVGTAGSPGHPGSPGISGTQGMAGMSASCPGTPGRSGGAGGPGGPGGRGGNGHPGGPGGDVVVTVVAPQERCEALSALARQFVESRGGPGGSGGLGGPGGQGGAGGMGGSGTSCYDYNTGTSKYLSGGTSGLRGMNGAQGPSGSPGAPGRPGEVVVRCVEE